LISWYLEGKQEKGKVILTTGRGKRSTDVKNCRQHTPKLEPCDKDGKRYDHAQLDGEDEDSEELAEYEQIYENEGTEAGNNLVGQLAVWRGIFARSSLGLTFSRPLTHPNHSPCTDNKK